MTANPLTTAEKIALVTEARILFGIPVGRRLWREFDLPFPGERKPVVDRHQHGVDEIKEFSDEQMTAADGARIRAEDVYVHYHRWCGKHGREAMTQTMFGRLSERAGLKKVRDGRVYYCDVAWLPRTMSPS